MGYIDNYFWSYFSVSLRAANIWHAKKHIKLNDLL